MPLKSKAQARWMWATHPAMAERWTKDTPGGLKSLPNKVTKSSSKKTRKRK